MNELLQSFELKIFPFNSLRRRLVRRALGFTAGPKGRRQARVPGKDSLHDVTYATFGIDPQEFYKERFHRQEVGIDLLTRGIFRYTVDFAKYLKISDFFSENFRGRPLRVLDLGCGSGVGGPTFKGLHENLRLYGVDISASCVETARQNGYEQVDVLDFTVGRLPYPDGFFDATISMDVFGHIEFRHKDHVVKELARVTRDGGMACHGAETGFVDYLSSRPDDPTDPIRSYVWEEGHVGVETIQSLRVRLEKAFQEVTPELPFVFPFGQLSVAIKEVFGKDYDEFAAYVGDDQSKKDLVSVVLGAVGIYQLQRYRAVAGDQAPVEQDEVRQDLHGLFQSHGFCFFIANKSAKHAWTSNG